MGRIEDLGLVVDKGLEWKQRAVDAEAERDQLSAEVESVKKKISVMGGEWMAEAIRAVVAEEKLDAATARAEAADKDAEIARSSSAESGLLSYVSQLRSVRETCYLKFISFEIQCDG